MKILEDNDENSNDLNTENDETESALMIQTPEELSAALESYRHDISKSYEAVMIICAHANVPDSARSFIDALIKLSNGEVVVKTNDFQIASVFHSDESKREALKKKVQRWRKKLDEWQKETGCTLIQIRAGKLTISYDDNGKL